jgi:hypothetical protein
MYIPQKIPPPVRALPFGFANKSCLGYITDMMSPFCVNVIAIRGLITFPTLEIEQGCPVFFARWQTRFGIFICTSQIDSFNRLNPTLHFPNNAHHFQ